ncbi:hypothetical protein EV1_039523 [Malus domestica]
MEALFESTVMRWMSIDKKMKHLSSQLILVVRMTLIMRLVSVSSLRRVMMVVKMMMMMVMTMGLKRKVILSGVWP